MIRRAGWMEGLGLLATLLASSWFLCVNGTRVYDFFDMSAFMDAGYRVLRGQRPYADFQFIAGPVHLYLHALFYRWLGFNRTAVLALLCSINAAFTTATYLLARRRLEPAIALTLAALTSLSFCGPISHPWYDHSACLWLVVGLLLADAEPRGRRPAAREAACGAALGLAFLTKANIGAAGTLLVAAMLFDRRKDGWAALAAFIAGFIGMVALVLALTGNPFLFIDQTLLAYRPGDRLLRFRRLLEVVVERQDGLLLLAGGLVLRLGGRPLRTERRGDCIAFFGLAGVSIFAAWTGSILIRANFPLLGPQLVYLFSLATRLPRDRARLVALAALSALTLFFACNAWIQSERLLAWMWREPDGGSNAHSDYRMRNVGLRGWRCNRQIGEGVDRTLDYLEGHVPKTDSLFVLPDATVIYGLSGHESYRGAPFMFNLGVIPFPGKYWRQFLTTFRSRPPLWIVLHHQTEVPICDTAGIIRGLQLGSYLREHYDEVWRWGDFAVLRWKSPPLNARSNRR